MTMVFCPIADYESESFLDLARHMNLKAINERQYGEHAMWLEGFFGVSLEQICHQDRKVALNLRSYWKKHHSWPQAEMESNIEEL
jgi:hypothetical protein